MINNNVSYGKFCILYQMPDDAGGPPPGEGGAGEHHGPPPGEAGDEAQHGAPAEEDGE